MHRSHFCLDTYLRNRKSLVWITLEIYNQTALAQSNQPHETKPLPRQTGSVSMPSHNQSRRHLATRRRRHREPSKDRSGIGVVPLRRSDFMRALPQKRFLNRLLQSIHLWLSPLFLLRLARRSVLARSGVGLELRQRCQYKPARALGWIVWKYWFAFWALSAMLCWLRNAASFYEFSNDELSDQGGLLNTGTSFHSTWYWCLNLNYATKFEQWLKINAS